MREKQWILLDNLKRKKFLKSELQNIVYKSLKKNSCLPQTTRYFIQLKKNQMIRSGSIVQQKNRCDLSGRRWAVSSKLRLSRFFFRKESYLGNLPGFSRASW